jgi:hypothetical protein
VCADSRDGAWSVLCHHLCWVRYRIGQSRRTSEPKFTKSVVTKRTLRFSLLGYSGTSFGGWLVP